MRILASQLQRLRRMLCVMLFVCVGLGVPALADNEIFVDIVIQNRQSQEFRYSAELAHTPTLRSRGLMYRQEFSSGQAMLFIWPVSARRLFWMKNTLVALDILFFSEDGNLFHIVHQAQPETEILHSSELPAATVIELKGGETKRLNIDIGSKLTIETALPEAR